MSSRCVSQKLQFCPDEEKRRMDCVLLRDAFDLWVYVHLCPEDRGGKWVYTPRDWHRLEIRDVHQELFRVCWERAAWGSQWNTDECRHLVRYHACLEELSVVGKPCVFPSGIPTPNQPNKNRRRLRPRNAACCGARIFECI